MPGPAPKPAQIHRLNGNPGRREHNQPRVELEAPPCPAWLNGEARAHWDYIVAELLRYGLVTSLDQAMLGAYCSSVALLALAEAKLADADALIDETPNGYRAQSVWLQVRNKAIEQVRALAPEFGLSPSARARVAVRAPEQQDLFDVLAGIGARHG